MTSRLLLGVVAKENVYAPELRAPTKITDSMICARCDGPMVITHDALQRPRKRCPRCDGTAAPKPPHPDQVLVPLTLGKLTADALPPVEPGQLRCQRCAKGVEGDARFHPECAAAIALEKKQRVCICGARFVLAPRSRATECSRCIAARKSKAGVQLCTGCNRIRPRGKGDWAVVKRCDDCTPASPTFSRCLACGHTWPRKPRAHLTYHDCVKCRPAKEKRPRAPAPAKLPAIRPDCGHPYPRRRGRRARDCETCHALAGSPSPAQAVA